MTRAELNQYIDAVKESHRVPFFIERFFRTDEEWERVSAFEFRNVNFSDRTEATLNRILERKTVIILGEPGSGKSTVAKATVHRSAEKGRAPIVAQLRSYTGDLRLLLETTASAELIGTGVVDGSPVARVLILDGVDEVPHSLVGRFIDD
jgi:DNA replication protein DnaC